MKLPLTSHWLPKVWPMRVAELLSYCFTQLTVCVKTTGLTGASQTLTVSFEVLYVGGGWEGGGQAEQKPIPGSQDHDLRRVSLEALL
jgi:hypothetical protein